MGISVTAVHQESHANLVIFRPMSYFYVMMLLVTCSKVQTQQKVSNTPCILFPHCNIELVLLLYQIVHFERKLHFYNNALQQNYYSRRGFKNAIWNILFQQTNFPTNFENFDTHLFIKVQPLQVRGMSPNSMLDPSIMFQLIQTMFR